MSLRALHNPGLPVHLSLEGMDLAAFSISGVATYLLAREFDACFDLGHCPVEASHLRHVFLSHTHQDHAGGVHRHLSLRAMTGASPSRIYCPFERAEALRELLRAWARLEEKDPGELDEVVEPVAPGDRVPLGRRHSVEVFDVRHRVASRGFTVIEHGRALRTPWVGRPEEEIAEAARAGEDLYVPAERRRLTYIGDSTVATLAEDPRVADCDVLFMEATHLPGVSRATAHRWGHTHIEELAELWARDPAALSARHIVLKHFSMKYREADIARAREALPEGLRERVVMLA